MKICAWCSNDFKPSVNYQIYCSVECREKATKEKISERYQINRRKSRSKKVRSCSGGCETKISIYNENGFCNVCMINKRKVEKMLKELKGLFEYEQE
jgi:uncharacterized protein YmfQ (DUF2313 family)